MCAGWGRGERQGKSKSRERGGKLDYIRREDKTGVLCTFSFPLRAEDRPPEKKVERELR